MSNMWKCYHCKKEIAPRAPTCPHCGGTFGVSERGFMQTNARMDANYAREKAGLPPKSNFGCAIPAAILGIGILSVVTFIGTTISKAEEIKLTQVKAEELIKTHTGKWARCLDIPVEDVYGGFNTTSLIRKQIVKDMCVGKAFQALFQACLVTQNRFQSDVIELTLRNIVQKSGRDKRDTVFVIKNNFLSDGYFASNGGALCGQFPDTGYSTQITRIEQTTDIRWEVSFSYQQTSNDPYYQRKLLKKRVKDKKAVEYRNGEFVVLDQ